MTRSFWAAPTLAIAGGLVLLLAGAAGWVTVVDARDIGGVVVTEPRSLPGTEYAPTAVAFGLGGLLGGSLLAFLRGSARRVVGGLLAAVAVAALAVLALGVSRALTAQGAVTPAPYVAAAASVGLLVAGAAAVRGPARPPVDSQYRVESERSEDQEWTLSSAEGDPDP